MSDGLTKGKKPKERKQKETKGNERKRKELNKKILVCLVPKHGF
jgi:hypothetical protein